jgi:hypothetical protein
MSPVVERREMVVVARLVVEVEVRVPVVNDPVVAVVAVRLVKNPVTAVRSVEKRLVVVALAPIAERKLREVIVEEEIVVVARADCPCT